MVKNYDSLWISLLLSFLTGQVAQCGEYCTYKDDNGFNKYIYCDGYCCSSEDDHCCTNYVGLIVGCVIGGVVFLAVVLTVIVLVCKKHKVKKGRVIQPTTSGRATIATTQHTHVGYNSNFGVVQPPPYSYNNPYPNQYGGVAGPSYIPPPAYPGPPTKDGNSTYMDGQGVARPVNINVQPQTNEAGQYDPVYPPPPVSS